MEELFEKFTTLINANESGRTNFEELYKNWGKLGNQEQRRKDLLDVQKSDRHDKLDKFRGIFDLVHSGEKHDIFKSEKAIYRPKIFVAGFTRTSVTYSNVLMQSEWMIEKPEDFEENWLVTPCPKGVRVLVVASQGTTKCYSKYGHFRLSCRTDLPGGNPNKAHNNRCCILDCFYVEIIQTMFVLDILAWNSQPMTDGEAEFRHFWLQTHLEDIPQLKSISKTNKLIFKLLPKVPCDPETFNAFMLKPNHFESHLPALDGLLFYHKKAHYFAGQTPLVGWLYPFMVPEVLGIGVKVHPLYMVQMPLDYKNQAEFIEKFEVKLAKKHEKVKMKGEPMDVATATNDNEKVKSSKKANKEDMGAEAFYIRPSIKTKKPLMKKCTY